jgi:hypothetical protein
MSMTPYELDGLIKRMRSGETLTTREAVAEEITTDSAVEQIMALAEKRHPWIDSDDASKMFQIIADWLRGETS